MGEKTGADGTIAKALRERKCNWPKNTGKMQFFIGTCGNRRYFSGFFGCRGFERNSVIFFAFGGYSQRLKVIRSETLQAKQGRAIAGNDMQGIGRKNFGIGYFAPASGGSGISGCGASGTGKIPGKRAVRLQFLAASRGGKIVLAGCYVFRVERGVTRGGPTKNERKTLEQRDSRRDQDTKFAKPAAILKNRWVKGRPGPGRSGLWL
jgi:hypothetical protein